MVKGLLKKNCDVTVVAAFPHYPYGNVPERYKRKAIVGERFGDAKVYRTWIPALPHKGLVNRLALHFCFIISSLFALPFVRDFEVVWGANPNLFSFFPSLIYGIIKRVPIIRNVDDLWPEVWYELGYVKPKIARKILNFLTYISYVIPTIITPISEGYKRVITSKYRIPSEKVHVIEVGIDIGKSVNAIKCLKNNFTVMYSGDLGLGYNFDIVLECAKNLQSNKEILFVIRGVGEAATGLKKRISELSLSNLVLDDRYLPKNELNIVLDSADVFVLPMADISFVEQGLPTKVFEYQSYGKPIICVSNGEASKYVTETRSGLVIKPKNKDAFTDAVVKLYTNRQLANELGFNGHEYVSKYLTVDKIGEKMYTELIVMTPQEQLLED